MKDNVIFDNGGYRWIVFARDENKIPGIIDTNQYMICTPRQAMLLDPGGVELFSSMLSAVLRYAPVEQITHLFASHQDPDIISSLGLWSKTLKGAKLHAPWMWEGFIRHFGCEGIDYIPIPDKGQTIHLGNSAIELIPAHYLHSSGNFHVYDPQARILMSGDVGAALEADDAPMYVDDFEEHIPKMEGFHKRWMPSNTAKKRWIERMRQLDIEMMAPQHGRIFRGEQVKQFLDWFDELEVGIIDGLES
jgi:flavorubredoxin